jgi:ATP-binding cassette subfamily C (CFTR/MRP) protein 1
MVCIDGYDICDIPRNTVRNRLICLPQDPLFFPGTFKFNLDPEGRTKSINQIETTLQKAGLWDLVERQGGLDAEMTPDSLSHGEQQLLVLGRAILHKQASSGRCILILDEATSNSDISSEMVVRTLVQEEFKYDTVISVAHRLDILKDMDRVILLDKGKIVKYGSPIEVIHLASETGVPD